MTIGQLLIMMVGFAGGIVCAFILAIHSIDEARNDARYWRNEALKRGEK